MMINCLLPLDLLVQWFITLFIVLILSEGNVCPINNKTSSSKNMSLFFYMLTHIEFYQLQVDILTNAVRHLNFH